MKFISTKKFRVAVVVLLSVLICPWFVVEINKEFSDLNAVTRMYLKEAREMHLYNLKPSRETRDRWSTNPAHDFGAMYPPEDLGWGHFAPLAHISGTQRDLMLKQVFADIYTLKRFNAFYLKAQNDDPMIKFRLLQVAQKRDYTDNIRKHIDYVSPEIAPILTDAYGAVEAALLGKTFHGIDLHQYIPKVYGSNTQANKEWYFHYMKVYSVYWEKFLLHPNFLREHGFNGRNMFWDHYRYDMGADRLFKL